MKAVLYESFKQVPTIENLPDPTPDPSGVIVKVEASGVCRSDWHAWAGHDPTVKLPHVPGHELAGVVQETGKDVTNWNVGDRITVPFVGGCGSCPQCHAGHQQVCDFQFQPGFTHWGSFAEYVGINQADLNLVALPDSMNFSTAASLGCRFVTAYRAVVDQSGVKPGQWLAVHGCGGVGQSAIMIGAAMGARVIGIDLDSDSLQLAKSLGAEHVIDASEAENVVPIIRDLTGGGAHVSIDALGIPTTCTNSIKSLRKRGRHVQLGWMLGDDSSPPVPMDLVMGWELEIVGSHGMQAHRYGEMINLIQNGVLEPEKLICEKISLEKSIERLARFDQFNTPGITIITQFN